MCKEMPAIPVDRVVDKKIIIGKMEGQGGGESQGVSDPKKEKTTISHWMKIRPIWSPWCVGGVLS
jgi:hypothetical protein